MSSNGTTGDSHRHNHNGGNAGSRSLPLLLQKLFIDRFELSAKYPVASEDRRSVIEGVYCAYKEGGRPDSDSYWGHHAAVELIKKASAWRADVLNSGSVDINQLVSVVQRACPPNLKITAVNFAYVVMRALLHLFVKTTDQKADAVLSASPSPVDATGDFTITGIFGHSEIRQQLHDAIVLPSRYHHHFQKCHLNMEIGMLLYGPPGTGKTLLVKSVAAQLRYNLVCIRLTDVIKGEVGTGETALIEAFQQAKRNHPPCIVFIDEFQALFTTKGGNGNSSGGDGSTLTSTLMSCLDDIVAWNIFAGPHALVSVIAATNEPWAIDPSFLRPGRFDRCILVGSLDKEARLGMLRTAIDEVQSSHKGGCGEGGADASSAVVYKLSDFEMDFLVNATDGYTGADVAALIRKCKMTCIDKVVSAAGDNDSNSLVDLSNVVLNLTFDCWLTALQGCVCSVKASLRTEYESWSHK